MDRNVRKKFNRIFSFGLRTLILLFFILFPLTSLSQGKSKKVFRFDGSQIEGQREKPKDLYILPWKKTNKLKESELSFDFLDIPLIIQDRYQLQEEFQYHYIIRELSN